jgi:hypothetical protein
MLMIGGNLVGFLDAFKAFGRRSPGQLTPLWKTA